MYSLRLSMVYKTSLELTQIHKTHKPHKTIIINPNPHPTAEFLEPRRTEQHCQEPQKYFIFQSGSKSWKHLPHGAIIRSGKDQRILELQT